MTILKDLLYTKSHEWVRFSDDTTAKIGLTDYAQNELGDLVFVNLPQEGDEAVLGASFSDVESVKAVSDVYSPVTGVVSAANEELLDHPELINGDAYAAWMVEIKDITEKEELLTAEQYEELIAKEA